ncbi:MAG: hypothetical protein K2M78_15975 [Lachnospiraceae bacterium]|nr:hypothetical protein [Lachnospiraceae bacterium]
MKYEELKNDFKEQIVRTLNDFSTTEQNKNVYAIVFDCDLENGQIVLRYCNLENFENLKQSWEEYKYMYEPYGQNGLFGLKYNSVGDFPMLKYEYNGMTKHFLNSYYYYSVGDYYGEEEPINVIEISGQTLEEDNLRTEIENIFIRMIIDTISEIKDMLEIINYDDDYLVFMCDHDISNDDFEKWVRKTNDDKLVDKLAQIMN